MTSLKIKDAGWALKPPADDASLPPQAFGLTLSSNVIEDMIRAAQNNQNIELSLGKSPTLHYGSKSHKIQNPADDAPFEFYLSRPYESTKMAIRLPHAGSLFKTLKLPGKPLSSKVAGKSGKSSGLEHDMETLQNGMAAHEAARDRTQVVDRLTSTKRSTKTKNGLLSGFTSGSSRSMPTSPGHKPNPSPSATPVLSATQLAMERAKEQRFVLVHELAVKERSSDYLKNKWQGKPEEFRSALEKVADQNSDSKLWSMRKGHWKELDVWKYDYQDQDERQKAIDNAIRQYDKQRLSSSEPEWQKLLPKEERGQGKCLSRLQANIAKGPPQPAPKIKVQKADDSSTSRDDIDSVSSERSRIGGEPMSRSNSSSLSAKAKKLNDLPKKASTTIKAPLSKKTSPVKAKPAAAKANGGKYLSQEIIVNSDSSGDEIPLARQKPVVSKVTASRPPPPSQPKSQASKRPRDDDDSSSSSGTPLSKRLKQKQPLLSSKLKDRPSDANQRGRNGTTAHSSTAPRAKNTSPTKSSPLASSPPTNASDMETDRPVPSKKRKVETDTKASMIKRRAVDSLSTAVVNKANKFKQYYQKYEALHYEVASLDNPPEDKVSHLLSMRGALESMKKEIYRECSPV